MWGSMLEGKALWLEGDVEGVSSWVSLFCSPSISQSVMIFSRNIDIVFVERVAVEISC
jgi:hypothetical protein